MKDFVKNWALAVGLTAVGALAAPLAAQAAELELTEVVDMLREEGVINEAQYESMYSKAEEKQNKVSWWDRLTLSGDLRVRVETFLYEKDAFGQGRRNRTRGRYRARLNIKAAINDHFDAVLRLASGQDDNRSTNTSFGSSPDWGPDSIFIDRAYLRWKPFADGSIYDGHGKLAVEAGRVPDPFQQKGIGAEYMLFDGDINFEGASVISRYEPMEDFIELMLNSGYYIIDEESGAQDPAMFAIQAGGTVQVSDDVRIGGRTSYYNFFNLNNQFFLRGINTLLPADAATAAAGNLIGGLSSSQTVNVVGGKIFANIDSFQDWPITVWGQVASNLSAEKVTGAKGRDDLAWMVGASGGNKRKFVELGMLYGQVQANAFPAQFQDSDWFDGVTNRKGFAWWGTRQIYPNTDLKLTIFNSKEIEDAMPYQFSVPGARRTRIMADVQVKF